MIKVLLVDDHALVRQGVKALLEQTEGISIVGETDAVEPAMALALKERPDVVVVDLMLQGASGLDLAGRLVREHGGAKVIILSMHSLEAYVVAAFRQGAVGYVLKGGGAEDLLNAIREVGAGRKYLSPGISREVLYASRSSGKAGVMDPHEKLTGREREVLSLAAQGLNNVEVGARLGISPRTVEIHRANMMRKLGLRTQSDLLCYVAGRKTLEPPGSAEPTAGQ
jgi:DNA-binding NarL/FixJ family response regulator